MIVDFFPLFFSFLSFWLTNGKKLSPDRERERGSI
jgi:hypothetical protein